MSWQLPVIVVILIWSIGALIWLFRIDKEIRDAQAQRLARIQLVVSIILFLVVLTTIF